MKILTKLNRLFNWITLIIIAVCLLNIVINVLFYSQSEMWYLIQMTFLTLLISLQNYMTLEDMKED